MSDNPHDHPQPPKPDDIEHHPAKYRWQERPFANRRTLLMGEGSVVLSATGEGSYWIIYDEGTMADFLPPGDDLAAGLVRLHRFDSRERWQEAVDHFVAQARKRFGYNDFETYEEARERWQKSLDRRYGSSE